MINVDACALPSSKKSLKPTKKTPLEHMQEFWAAPMFAFFGQVTIAIVCDCSTATLESNRWRGMGIPYRKVSGRVLYRKCDVVQWLEKHVLIQSTSDEVKEQAL
jgi:hypothetical protein